MRAASFACTLSMGTLFVTLAILAAPAQTIDAPAAASPKTPPGAPAPTTMDAKSAAAGMAAGADAVAKSGAKPTKARASQADNLKTGVAKSGVGKSGFAFKSVTEGLPLGDDQVFPDGRFVQAVNKDCRLCHSPDMILNQPALPKGGWRAEVIKMRDVYKASVPDDDIDAIAAYLETTIGLNRPHWR